ncbi:MAG: inositol monophosphatase [Polaromonas sp.]|nr:inositol monophosphatase [Polaromonas sp.]
MSSNLHPMLNVAVKAARAAGALINRAALDVEAVRVSLKQTNDFVTEVDQAAEAAIIDILLTAYPTHGIVAEESGSEQGAKDAEFVWIIDPLDGTTNFIHGFPFYCVSIALAVRGKVEQAVVYDPIRNDIYSASKGRGSYVNDRRIRVGKRTRLQDSLISTGFPYRPGDKLKPYLNMLGEVMSQCAGVRRPGAAALDLAHVAAGLTDGFFETGLQPWDVAAGSLLVTEAGGLIGNFTGEADFIEHGECVAGNPKIYAQLVGTLARYSRFAGAGDKASVRQAGLGGTEGGAPAAAAGSDAAAPAAKPTLKARRIKGASDAGAEAEAAQPVPDAPF